MKATIVFFLLLFSSLVSSVVALAQTAPASPPAAVAKPALPRVLFKTQLKDTSYFEANDLIQSLEQDKRLQAKATSASSETDADLVIWITDQPADNDLEYGFSIQVRHGKRTPTLLTFKAERATSQRQQVLAGLAKEAGKLLTMYNAIHAAESGEENASLTAQVDVPAESADGAASQEEDPYAFSLSAYGNFYDQGAMPYNNNGYSASASGNANYLTRTFKQMFTLSGGMSHSSSYGSPVTTRYETNSSYQVATSISVFSLSDHWDVAVIGSYWADTNWNIRSSYDLKGGVEWLLVPIRTSEIRQAVVRAGVGQSTIELYQPNLHQATHETYPIAFLVLSAYQVILKDKVTLTANFNTDQNLKYRKSPVYNFNFNVNWNVRPSVQIGSYVGFTYRGESLTRAVDPSAFANPLQNTSLGGQTGWFKSWSGYIRINLGNRRFYNGIQHWR